MATKVVEKLAFTGGRVRREAGRIENVTLCGNRSANRRHYPPAVFKSGAMYEGKPVHLDHSPDDRERGVADRIGWVSDVRVEGGRPVGTLNILRSHPLAEAVFEMAERNPSLVGLSHVCRANTRRDRNGDEVVESIESVEAVDLVADPATVRGLFESTQRRQAMRPTIREQAVRLARAAAVSARLSEQLDGGTAGVADGLEQVVLALARGAVRGDLEPEEAMRKIRKTLSLAAALKAGSDPDDELPDDGEEVTDLAGASESRRLHWDDDPPPTDGVEFARRIQGKLTQAEYEAFLRRISGRASEAEVKAFAERTRRPHWQD